MDCSFLNKNKPKTHVACVGTINDNRTFLEQKQDPNHESRSHCLGAQICLVVSMSPVLTAL